MNTISKIQAAAILAVVVLAGVAQASERELVSSGLTYTQTLEDKLRRAASQGDLDGIRRLLAAGARIDSSDIDGYTPLICAVSADQPEAVSLLLERGADVNRKAEKSGHTALSWSAVLGYTHLMDNLIQAGADIEVRNKRGRTPLMEAALRGYESTARKLLASGADPNAKDRRGRTAMAMAAYSGHNEVASALVTGGAVEDITTRKVVARVRNGSISKRRLSALTPHMMAATANTASFSAEASQAQGSTAQDRQGLVKLAAQATDIWQQIQSQYPEVATRLRGQAPQMISLCLP